MRKVYVGLTIFLSFLLICTAGFAGEISGVSPDAAKAKLIEGNTRFVTEKHADINIGANRRAELVNGQHPFAVILGCSDSRVPPEIIFDQGLGDLFIVRTAGNTIDDFAIGSIEYAVRHLDVKLIVVLGHENCRAVTAATGEGLDSLPSHWNQLVDEIKPAVDQAKTQKGDLVTNAVADNVDLVVNKLRSSEPILSEFNAKGSIKIIGAVYDLNTGTVSFR